jgi:hypothetical protein
VLSDFRGPYLENDPNAFEKYFLNAKAILDEQIRAGRKVHEKQFGPKREVLGLK